MPYPTGGDVAVIVTSREVTPIERLADLADEQRQAAQLANEMQAAQIEKVKQPPPKPVVVAAPPAGQHPPQGNQTPAADQPGGKDGAEPPAKESDDEYSWLWDLHHPEALWERDRSVSDQGDLAKQIDALFQQVARRGKQSLEEDDEDE